MRRDEDNPVFTVVFEKTKQRMENSLKSEFSSQMNLLVGYRIHEDARYFRDRTYIYIHVYIFERMGNINNGIQASVSSFVAQ